MSPINLKTLCFNHHPSFIGEMEGFITHHCSGTTTAEEAVINIQRLLSTHFLVSLMLSSKHLGRAQGFNGYEVYWLHFVVPNINLSRTQQPKAYFYKDGFHICFLCLDSHLQNYKDSKLRSVAGKRLEEIIEVLKVHTCPLN